MKTIYFLLAIFALAAAGCQTNSNSNPANPNANGVHDNPPNTVNTTGNMHGAPVP